MLCNRIQVHIRVKVVIFNTKTNIGAPAVYRQVILNILYGGTGMCEGNTSLG